MTAVVVAATGRWRFNRDHSVTGVAVPFNSHMREARSSRSFLDVFSRINTMLGRTETRNRDRMYCQSKRTV